MASKTGALKLSLIFAFLGASASLLPAFIPQSAIRLAASQSELLTAVPLMFAGLFIGVAIAPFATKLVGARRLNRAGFVAMALALFALPFVGSAEMFLFAALVLGLGFGVLEVLATSAARKLKTDTSQKLTNLNAVFALSALTSPLVLIVSVQFIGFPVPFFLAALMALALFAAKDEDDLWEPPVKALIQRPNSKVFVLMLAAMAFVGAESVMSGWSATAVNQLTNFDANAAAVGSSAFWGLLAIGRLVSASISPRLISNQSALMLWSLVAGVSLIYAAISWPFLSGAGLLLLFSVAAFAAGPCYALIVGQALDASDLANSVGLTSTIVLLGAAGGFLLPGLLQLNPELRTASALAGAAFVLTLLFVAAASMKFSRVKVKV